MQRKIKLKDAFMFLKKSKIKAGDGLKVGKYPLYTSSSILSKYLDSYEIEGESLIFGTGGSASVHHSQGKFSSSTDCFVVQSNSKFEINLRYVYLFLIDNIHILENGFKGAGLKHISKKYLEDIEIPIPSLETQKKIVEVLDKAQGLIDARKEQIRLMDELIQSVFYEMFGDPVVNPKGWKTPLIEDLASDEKNALKAGPFGSSLKKEFYVEKGYKIYGQEQVIRGDVTFGDYYINENKYQDLKSCSVKANDVLISLVGTYGKLLIIPQDFEPGIINPRLLKITFDKEKINIIYFKYFFKSESLMRALSANTHGGTMPILNLGIVRKIKIPLPPLQLQDYFESFIKYIDKLKYEENKSLDEMQILFNSLKKKCFK